MLPARYDDDDDIDFTTLYSLYLVYRALFTFSLVGSAGVFFFSFGWALQLYLIIFK